MKVGIIVEFILIGEVGRIGVRSSYAAGVAGHEVAHVREAGGRITNSPASVRASRGVATDVEQCDGGAGGGRGGGDHLPAFTHLHRGDVVTWLNSEECFRSRLRIQPILWKKKRFRLQNDTRVESISKTRSPDYVYECVCKLSVARNTSANHTKKCFHVVSKYIPLIGYRLRPILFPLSW